MPNLFPPKVTVFDTPVQLEQDVAFSSLFSVADLDPGTVITKYRFRDNGSAATSGYFTLNGVKQAANVWIEIDASQINNVFFQSALIISSESIGIEAFDGLFWSDAAFGTIFSVEPNIRKPEIVAQNTSVLSSEGLLVSSFVSASDPDGYPIQKFLFVDRSFNQFGGFFSLEGVRQASAVWFEVPASQLSKLRYIGGQNAGSESIGIQVFDGLQWSDIVDVVWTTTGNFNAPTVTAFDLTLPINRVISADQLFQFLDLDGNTMKKLQFFDTGVLPTGGFFTVDGVVQAPNVWFEVQRDKFGTIEYHTASVPDFERFRVKVFDGKFWSTNASAKIVSQAPPDFIIPRVLILDAYEERLASTQISLAGGPGIQTYEFIDLNDDPTSGKLLVGGAVLDEEEVHTLTPAQFASLEFKGGQDDRGREFDNIRFRGFNGVSWSDWHEIDVNTDAFAEVALDAGTDWDTTPGTLTLTYTFILGIPGYYAIDDDEYTGGPVPLTSAQRNGVRYALDVLERYIDVDFVEVPQATLGTMIFGKTDLPEGVAAWAYFPSGPGKPGDVWLDKLDPDNEAMNIQGISVVLHELGHALGLTHTFQESPGDFTNLPAAAENRRYSMMSYTPLADRRQDTPMIYDIRELQKDYGANLSYNLGNNVISLENNYNRFQTIWDAGGIDTLDLGNQTASVVGDLREGRYSSIGGETDSVAIAYGTAIENLEGGFGNDTLFGNSLNNIIRGNGGNDQITGFSGNDSVFGGAGNDRYNYTLGDGFDTINEETSGGRETLTIRGFGDFNSFTNDLSFRVINGRDLDIQLTIDGDESQGGIVIKDMAWGGSRVETLRIQGDSGSQIGPSIDLRSIFVYSTTALQKFAVTEFTSEFGSLAAPV